MQGYFCATIGNKRIIVGTMMWFSFFFDTYPDLQDNISRGSAEGTANQGNVLQSNVPKPLLLSPAVGGTTRTL